MPSEKIMLPASPIGIFTSCFLDKPSTMYDSYSVKCVMDPDAKDRTGRTATELHAWLSEKLAEHRANVIKATPKFKSFASYLPMEKEIDEATGDETERFVLRAKQPATLKRKDGTVVQMKVSLFDSKGKKMVGIPVGRGSKGRIAGKVVGFCNEATKQIGLTIYLEGAVVTSLVAPGNRDANDFGFGEEEDGFEQSTEQSLGQPEAGEAAVVDGTEQF